MRINKIVLYNFGPYEGLNEFNICEQSNTGRIVLIGGKNGAGKTTLFSAIRICMYGYREGGYQSPNSYYKKKVRKLINDKAKREEQVLSYVEVELSIVRGAETDTYVIKREWTLTNTDVVENILVVKNGETLCGDEINDFDNYLLSVIPPELFDLYFFDGEKISDFFMEDGSNSRIKNAFLILCGYDNFEIMYKNFKRLGVGSKTDGGVIKRYTESKDKLDQIVRLFEKVNLEIDEKRQEIISVKTEIEELERRYRDKGGVTIEEWNDNFIRLKKEEQYREARNEWIKKAANDIIPFIILRKKLYELSEVVLQEESAHEQETLVEMCAKIVQDAIKNVAIDDSIRNAIEAEIDLAIAKVETPDIILGLSLEEKKLVTGQLYALLSLDEKEVLNNRKDVRASIARSKKIRELIENSSVSTVQEYFTQKEELLVRQAKLVESLNDLIQYTKDIEINVELQREIFKRDSRLLEEALKKESLSDVTAKAIILLEKLQERLFAAEIAKVETLFMSKIRELARKNNFVDDIKIDDEFNVHLFKKVTISADILALTLQRYDEEGYKKENGINHWNYLLTKFSVSDKDSLVKMLLSIKDNVEVLYELDKTKFSNGEKQVYIMTLYWAIMRLCKQEVPFIIDTPFARIDSEHRTNIAEKFFDDLVGQVFIFSTNEEIVGQHLEILGDSVQAKFLLENTDNERTTICANAYFGG